MGVSSTALARRIRDARVAAEVSQDEAAEALGISQPTYYRIEAGSRRLEGDELVLLAAAFGVRAAAIAGLSAVEYRARFAVCTDGTSLPMNAMRERLYSYLELDSYLADQGLASI